MSKKKTSPKSTKKSPAEKKLNFEIPFKPDKRQVYIIFSTLLVLSIALPVYLVTDAISANNSFGFPLDDPWIHLTFAKNLAEYQSFSYFKNEMATAGSTSPIYTILLAAGFFITSNEFILSYFIGIAFFALAAFFFYRLSSFEFEPENFFAVVCSLFFVIDKWMNFISVSGMETSMFIFILIACAYFYRKRKIVPFAIFLGLIIWTRPDGLAFIGALAVDYAVNVYYLKNSDKKFSKQDLIKGGIIFGFIIALYFGMNLMLSGSLLPNTYNAKVTYYSPEYRSRADFLKFEVWGYFTEGAYGIFMAGFIFSILFLLYNISKKRYDQNLLYITFILALIFLYWYKLPYAHRFGRYMMPVIPFFILVSVIGFRDAFRMIGSYLNNRQIAASLTYIISGVLLLFSSINYFSKKSEYAYESKYISDRQVAAAYWIRNNTKETDVIATHDIGAIGFYSNRKIVDLAGLVNPELINKLLDINYVDYARDYMKEQGTDYLVVLREWFRVTNQNPLWTTIDKTAPGGETMEIYKFNPDSTHILRSDVKSMIMYAENALSQRLPQQAMQALNQAIATDPNSALTYYLTANAYAMMRDAKNFEKNILKAVEIYPDYKEALFQLGNYYKSQDKNSEAKKYLERYVSLDVNNKQANELLRSLNDTTQSIPFK